MTAEVLGPVTTAEYYYTYAGDHPINFVDPTGMFSFGDVLQGIATAVQVAIGCAEGAGAGALIGFVALPELSPVSEIAGGIGGCALGGLAAYYNVNEPIFAGS